MRPFTVLIGIILGSAVSITFGLVTVLIVFTLLGGEHPELRREYPQLAMSFAAFATFTAASAWSFLGELKARPWRGWAHLVTLACLGLVVALHWPRRI